MKLKPTKRATKKVIETPKPKQKRENRLPPDEYKPIFPPQRFLVRCEPSLKDETKEVKQYLEITLKRFNDDAKPYVWLTMYQESELYTGYLKGKTVYLPLEKLYDLVDELNALGDKCDQIEILE